MITISRALMIGLAAVFSAYHVILGIASLERVTHPGPVVLALVLFALATIASLWPTTRLRLAGWIAAVDLGVAVALPLLVTSQLDPHVANGYATWYVAAVGTLMTIAAVRRRVAVAWIALLFLVVDTLVWSGPLSLVQLGVLGDVVWVGLAHITVRALRKSARDARQFVAAEREAAAWQAAQDAHFSERNTRLTQTARAATPMLRRIVESSGDLSAADRRECRYLEAAIRDEIRGRRLLDDAVRDEVMAARRRGTVVTLLDEGGIDDLEDGDLRLVYWRLAAAIRDSRSDRLVVRTVPRDSDIAVTVVGISTTDDGNAIALGADDEEDELDLFLEIPRSAVVTA